MPPAGEEEDEQEDALEDELELLSWHRGGGAVLHTFFFFGTEVVALWSWTAEGTNCGANPWVGYWLTGVLCATISPPVWCRVVYLLPRWRRLPAFALHRVGLGWELVAASLDWKKVLLGGRGGPF
ncbi:unnamed protein product [Calypogeia fissa]